MRIRSSRPRLAQNRATARLIRASDSSITWVTVKPPTPGSAIASANSAASRPGERSCLNSGSSYLEVAITSADRTPAGSLGAGREAGKPGIDESFLLLGRRPAQLQRPGTGTDRHAHLDFTVVTDRPVREGSEYRAQPRGPELHREPVPGSG